MSRIKFSFIESYLTSDASYLLTFIIHEQDLQHRMGIPFISSNGMIVESGYYGYICPTKIYVNSNRKFSDESRGFIGVNTSIRFDTHSNMLIYKEKALQALKEWSQNEV